MIKYEMKIYLCLFNREMHKKARKTLYVGLDF